MLRLVDDGKGQVGDGQMAEKFMETAKAIRQASGVGSMCSGTTLANLMIERGSSSGSIFSLMMPGFSGGAKDSPEPASSSQPASQVRPTVDADFQEPAGMNIGLQIPGFLPDQVRLSFAWKPVFRSACNVPMHFVFASATRSHVARTSLA